MRQRAYNVIRCLLRSYYVIIPVLSMAYLKRNKVIRVISVNKSYEPLTIIPFFFAWVFPEV